jgi:hypothetical protein
MAVNGAHSLSAIRTHSGHDDSEGAVPEGFSHRTHQDIDRGDVQKVLRMSVETKNRT